MNANPMLDVVRRTSPKSVAAESGDAAWTRIAGEGGAVLTGMDLRRTDQHVRRRMRWVIAGAIALGLAGITTVVARLDPAVPTVPRSALWIDTVKRGPMLRQVRGIGSLVPEEITWIAARTQGRVDRVLLRPGAAVGADDVILVLTNPQLRQAAADAESQLNAAEAELVSLKSQLQSGLLAAEATAVNAKADYEQAKLRAEVNERLIATNLVSELELQLSRVTAEQTRNRYEIEQKRLAFARTSIEPQLAVKRAEVNRLRAQAQLRAEELAALNVRAGMDGVLQVLQVEVGAQVGPGTNLARVADPTRLKAEVRIPETQARDVKIGQSASIDTRNGMAHGQVSRIDPAVQNGTVMVDVSFTAELPRGARPDLSIEGTIELERLDDVTFVGRPAFGHEAGAVGMFRLDANGSDAEQIPVELGRASVSTVEIVKGLRAGDSVILSDMSRWAEHDRIRIN